MLKRVLEREPFFLFLRPTQNPAVKYPSSRLPFALFLNIYTETQNQ